MGLYICFIILIILLEFFDIIQSNRYDRRDWFNTDLVYTKDDDSFYIYYKNTVMTQQGLIKVTSGGYICQADRAVIGYLFFNQTQSIYKANSIKAYLSDNSDILDGKSFRRCPSYLTMSDEYIESSTPQSVCYMYFINVLDKISANSKVVKKVCKLL